MNEEKRATFQKLFDECEARTLKEKKSNNAPVPAPADTQKFKFAAQHPPKSLVLEPSTSKHIDNESIEEMPQQNTSSAPMNKAQNTTKTTEEEALLKSGFDKTLGQMKNAIKTEPKPIIADEGKRLYRALFGIREEFLRTGNSNNLACSVKELVKKSEPVLKKSPIWKQFLLDILNAVLFIVTLSISYWVTGRFRLFAVQPPQEIGKQQSKDFVTNPVL